MSQLHSIIHTKNLAIGYGKGQKMKSVLQNINVSAGTGELTALLGANGTGKSTLLRTLAGLQPELAGDIWLDSENARNLSAAQKATILSVVLTDRVYPGYLTVGDLVAMGRHPYTDWQGRLREEDKKASLEAMSMTGLSELKQKDLHELSDGQLQKAMIARALAQDGPIMLLDEPLIHLDIPSKWEIMTLLKQMATTKNKTVILATHELELSLQMADRIWLIDKKGELIKGSPSDMVLNGVISATFNTEHYKFR